jgi:hypothetical protein
VRRKKRGDGDVEGVVRQGLEGFFCFICKAQEEFYMSSAKTGLKADRSRVEPD